MEAYRKRYHAAEREERSSLLDEFCEISGYHRKYAIGLLNRPDGEEADRPRRRRGVTYSSVAVGVVEAVWKTAGYPWSARLKALLPLWMPWARGHIRGLSEEVERHVRAISGRQIDRRLSQRKRRLRRGLYGRTKPGTLLKHHIPVKAEPWDVAEPGYAEIDLVSHSGPSARGEFGYSLNLTDVYLGWCETRAILGRGEEGVVAALDEIRRALPFPLRAIDPVVCAKRASLRGSSTSISSATAATTASSSPGAAPTSPVVKRTRILQGKKDDNAHIEQKNWTHVRRIFGWDRYDTPKVIAAMNDLYRGDLRRMMNLFQPSVKLIERKRVGSRLTRRYDAARTPLDRLADLYAKGSLPPSVLALLALRDRTDPFELSAAIEGQLDQIERTRSGQPLPSQLAPARRPAPPLPPRRGWAVLETTHAR